MLHAWLPNGSALIGAWQVDMSACKTCGSSGFVPCWWCQGDKKVSAAQWACDVDLQGMHAEHTDDV